MNRTISSPSSITISSYTFDGAAVRVSVIDGREWFVARDVALALGYAEPRRAIEQHCKGGAKYTPLTTAGGVQEARVISEPDLYRLIIGSNLPAAQRFEAWVFDDVLPSIRRTGGYIAAAPEETPEELALRAMAVLCDTVERQKAQLAVAAPKAEALDRLSDSAGNLTPTAAAKALQVGRDALLTFMRSNKWIYRDGERWLAYQDRIKAGFLIHKVTTLPREGRPDKLVEQILVTPKGLAKLATVLGATPEVAA